MLRPWLVALCLSTALAAPAGSCPMLGSGVKTPTKDLTATRQDQKNDDQQKETPDDVRAEAEEGVKHMLVSQIEAWNHGKLEAFMSGYWHSPDLEFFSGTTVTKGWEPTLLRYRQRYQAQGKEMGHLEFQDLHVDVLGRKAAVVTGAWELTMSDGKKPHGLFTLIVKRMPGGWKIVHDHTSGE